ncbi:MAG: hypothetical protein IT355_07090 [Gemmatimonadaceae bacterium]|nr:hypothetical protein [Gemmatimonadaceae bacterium]
MVEEKAQEITAPYGSYSTFKTFFGDIKKKGAVPPQVDSSVLSSKAGTAQRDIKIALRFFGLVTGPALESTPAMRSLVEAHDTEAWKGAVANLYQSYEPLLQNLQMSIATQQQLEQAMERGGLKGADPKTKAARFFLALCKDAGIPVSPHFKAVRPGAGGRKVGQRNGTKKAVKTPDISSTTPADMSDSDAARQGLQIIRPLPDSPFAVHMPAEMQEEDAAFALRHLIDYLRLRKKWFRAAKIDFGEHPVAED